MTRTRLILVLLVFAGACGSSSTEPASAFVPCAIGYKRAVVDGVDQCVPR